jgi:G8 domain
MKSSVLRRIFGCAAALALLQLHFSPRVSAHEEINKLTPSGQATNIAVRSGNWSAPEIWDPQPPKRGAKIWIRPGITVTIDQQFFDPYEWVRVDGLLRFEPNGHTALAVETLTVEHTGRLEIGTAREPVAGGAVLTFQHRGEAINHDYDPSELSRGLEMAGLPKSSWVSVSRLPAAGDAWLRLDRAPSGWAADDVIVLTAPTYGQDETFRILSIDGDYITLDHPIKNARRFPVDSKTGQPYEGLALHVANLSRNVVVRTHADHAGKPSLQGHVMLMHHGGHQIRYVQFSDLGRTTIAPVSDPIIVNGVRDPSLAPICGLKTENVRGRYSLHFHMAGPGSAQSLVEGSVVAVARGSGLKIGFINHSSNVSFRDNVGYQIDGSTFFTEEGDEVGEFAGNLAIYSTGSNSPNDGLPAISCMNPYYPELYNRRRHDVGHRGHGFWIHGGGVEVSNNIAVGHGSSGFEFFSRPLYHGLTNTYAVRFPVALLRDGGKWAGSYDTLPVDAAPGVWRDNVAYVTSTQKNSRKVALSIHYHGLQQWKAFPGSPKNLIDGFLGWNTVNGVTTSYSGWFHYHNVRLFNGDATDGTGMRLGTQGGNHNIVDRIAIDGFQSGLQPSSSTAFSETLVNGEPYLPPVMCASGVPCDGGTEQNQNPGDRGSGSGGTRR